MAFSFRKMFSNIPYFKRDEFDNGNELSHEFGKKRRHGGLKTSLNPENLEQNDCHKLPHENINTIQSFPRKGSSESDIPNLMSKKQRCQAKKLKLDIDKANRSLDDVRDRKTIENTPRKITLSEVNSEQFCRHMKLFDFDQSYDAFDLEEPVILERSCDIESLSDTDSDTSADVKLCHKSIRNQTPDSFVDMAEQREDERVTLLLSYQMKLEKLDHFLKSLLTDFQIHIDVSNIFETENKTAKVDDEWAIVDRKDTISKHKLKTQLQSMQQYMQEFIDNLKKRNHKGKKLRINKWKSLKRLHDFPDLGESLHNLFSEVDLSSSHDCNCQCHCVTPDSGYKMEEKNQSITSSIGNFSLNNSTISAYSESLDIASYNSFNDSNLYGTMLLKPAIERIKFYVQVHGIVMTEDSETTLKFSCRSCGQDETDEHGLLKHILSQKHCEKIHFLYKTAYIKQCFASGKEIQPSSVLNAMTMYRDENKIVCFGDGQYACSLCFENGIVGESVLMAHCNLSEHIDRRDRLGDILETSL